MLNIKTFHCRKDTLWLNFRRMQKKFGKAFDFHPDTFQVTLKSLLARCLFVSDYLYLGSSIGIGSLGYM